MAVIALLTDFGLSDNFPGVMKAVILNINPRVNLVDISHNIPAQDIPTAAFLLKGSYKYFPPKTIFVTVVDPGVGSQRKPVIIKSRNYFFVGPDNGVLSLAAEDDGFKRAVMLENKKYFLKPLSHTFHGRDIFAPAAGYLSKGKALNSFGGPIKSIERLNITQPLKTKNTLRGKIIYIDRFGNLITNIEQGLFRKFTGKNKFRIKIKNKTLNFIAKSYQQVRPGNPLAIFGSFGFLEISLNCGSAKDYFKAIKGTEVSVVK